MIAYQVAPAPQEIDQTAFMEMRRQMGDTPPTPSFRGAPAREIEHSANILVGFEGGL